jgi:hypothetical protein
MKLRALCLVLILFSFVFAEAASLSFCRGAVSRLEFSSVNTAEFFEKPANEPTVTHLRSLSEDPNFAILKLTGRSWRSVWSPDGQNLQSDPRNLLILLGDNIAEKLGFKWIDKNTLRVPKGKYFSSQLLKLNNYLREIKSDPLEISFYDTAADSPLVTLDFLEKALQKRFPVASAGHFLIHDVAAHYGSILLPRAITREISMKIFVAQKFMIDIDPILKKLPPEASTLIRKINHKWFQIVAARADTVSGNFTLRYVDIVLSGKTKQEKEEFFEKEYLKHIRSETTEQLMKNWINFIFLNFEQFRFQMKNFDEQFDIVHGFTSQFLLNLPQGAKQPITATARELIDEIEKKRLQISLWDGS